MIALLLSIVPQVQVVGLAPGEELSALAPAPPAPRAEVSAWVVGLARGRVVDAFTGRPVAGGTVETWSEEMDAVHGGFWRAGETRTGADGQFTVTTSRAPKARVSAPGYLRLSTTTGELHGVVTLFPAQAEPVRVRVLDLRDRPIAGARVTSTYSCSHDLPAFDVLTDARGFAALPGYGLQDDMQELRLRAPGHMAIEYLHDRRVLSASIGGEPYTVRLPRRRPAAVRLLDLDGSRLAGAAVQAIDDECYHVVRTDAEGLLRVPSRYGNDELHLELLVEREYPFFFTLRPPQGAIVSLRRSAEDWPEETEEGRVRIEWPGDTPGDRRVPTQLFHEDGWARWVRVDAEEPHPFPAGRGLLFVGGAFSGYAEELLPFDLAPGAEVVLRPRLEREPRVRVRVPEGKWSSLWIEAGDDTLETEPGDEAVAVPAGRPLCFYLEGAGAPRRAFAAEALEGMVVDLSAEGTRVGAEPAQRHLTRATVVVDGALPDAPGELRVESPVGDCSAVPDTNRPGSFAVEGPAGAPFLAAYRRAGAARTWVRGRLPDESEPAPSLRLAAVELAALVLAADFPFAVEGPLGTVESDDSGEADLGPLHPGPLNLVLEEPDGRRHGLSLDLAPGSRRRLELRRELR